MTHRTDFSNRRRRGTARWVGNEAFLAKWRGQVALPAGKWQRPYLTTVNRAALGRSVSVAAAGVIAGRVPRW